MRRQEPGGVEERSEQERDDQERSRHLSLPPVEVGSDRGDRDRGEQDSAIEGRDQSCLAALDAAVPTFGPS